MVDWVAIDENQARLEAIKSMQNNF